MSDMSKNSDDATKELDSVLKALQRSLLEASNDDVIKRLQAASIDPLKAMETMRFAEDRALEEHFRHVRADEARDLLALARHLRIRGVAACGEHPRPMRDREQAGGHLFA